MNDLREAGRFLFDFLSVQKIKAFCLKLTQIESAYTAPSLNRNSWMDDAKDAHESHERTCRT